MLYDKIKFIRVYKNRYIKSIKEYAKSPFAQIVWQKGF